MNSLVHLPDVLTVRFTLFSMEKQHLTYFKIENFKRFDSFEMSNLGQFNLIVGDNNVGKTSVLEGLLFDEDITVLSTHYLVAALIRKDFSDRLSLLSVARQIHLWNTIFKYADKPITVSLSESGIGDFKIELRPHASLTNDEIKLIKDKLIVTIPKFWLKLYNHHESQLISAYFENDESSLALIPFMSATQSSGEKMVDLFYAHFNSDKARRKELEENIKLFVSNLEEVRVHRLNEDIEIFSVEVSNERELIPIARYGDGTIRYIGILMDVLSSRNKRLMIDEIGAGIHFTRLKTYWKTILQLCAKYNVQLFATTHSLECQQAFIEAFEDPEMQQYHKDARNISLIENKQGEVKAITYDFEQFEYALTIGFNTRGGAR